MQDPKITLSSTERDLYQNAEVILTKNSILQKTISLLQLVQERLTAQEGFAYRSLPHHTPKISRGENYQGLPYVVLDYPRVAKGDDLFFVRSFFWWGNFYSTTLQLAGIYKEQNRPRLLTAFSSLAEKDYFVGVNADPWAHHFGQDNYMRIHELTKEAFAFVMEQQPHIEIAARWPLHEWDAAAKNLVESWAYLRGLIA